MDNNKTPDPFNKTDNFTTLKGFENPIIVKEKSKPKEPSNALVAADKKEEKNPSETNPEKNSRHPINKRDNFTRTTNIEPKTGTEKSKPYEPKTGTEKSKPYEPKTGMEKSKLDKTESIYSITENPSAKLLAEHEKKTPISGKESSKESSRPIKKTDNFTSVRGFEPEPKTGAGKSKKLRRIKKKKTQNKRKPNKIDSRKKFTQKKHKYTKNKKKMHKSKKNKKARGPASDNKIPDVPVANSDPEEYIKAINELVTHHELLREELINQLRRGNNKSRRYYDTNTTMVLTEKKIMASLDGINNNIVNIKDKEKQEDILKDFQSYKNLINIYIHMTLLEILNKDKKDKKELEEIKDKIKTAMINLNNKFKELNKPL